MSLISILERIHLKLVVLLTGLKHYYNHIQNNPKGEKNEWLARLLFRQTSQSHWHTKDNRKLNAGNLT